MHPVLLQTPRLNLSLVTPSVIKHLFASCTQQEIMQYFNCDDVGYFRYKEMLEKGMETFRISFAYFLIIDRVTGMCIGECGFHTWNATHKRTELFYHLLKEEYKRKGYLSEVLPLVIDYGFTKMNLHRIEALLADDNIASKRLLEKNFFTREGVMREDYIVDGVHTDSACYSLLYGEWENRKAQ